jgi:hypothetical protein
VSKETYLVPHAASVDEKMRAWSDHRQHVRRSEAPQEALNVGMPYEEEDTCMPYEEEDTFVI